MERKCVTWQYIFDICVGMYVFVKAGREVFKGTVTKVGPTAIVLDNETIIRLSTVKWINIQGKVSKDEPGGEG